MKDRVLSVLVVSVGLAVTAQAQQPGQYTGPLGLFAFPANGQSPATQAADEAACYQWAQQATGIQNPTQPPAPVQAQQTDTGGRAGRGALRGAAAGALINEGFGYEHNSNEAAWAGAIIGGAKGAKEAQVRNQQAQQKASAATEQQFQAQMDTFNKAFSACLEGKQYTVK
jgi:outer membrane lipoprotein SlyB